MNNRFTKDDIFKQAEVAGYSLIAHFSDDRWMFGKGELALEIDGKTNFAALKSRVQMVLLCVDTFSWPHPRFEVLESQMQKAVEATKQALGVTE